MLALAIAIKYDLEIHQMYICTAFLGVDLEDEIYIHLPQGCWWLVHIESRYDDPTSMTSRKIVLRLRKPLYGWKQSSRVWFGPFKDFRITIGFVASSVDRELFVLDDTEQGIVVAAVILNFDHLLIIGNEGLIGQINDQMKMSLQMHDLGSVSIYVGMNIECSQKLHTINIHQHNYILMILAKFQMDESTPVAVPMAMKLHKRKPDVKACNTTIYQSMIGSHMYTMTATWPDITDAIRVLSQNNHDPKNKYMVALKRRFWYLNGTKTWQIDFRGALGGEAEGALWCNVHSDYAEYPDDFKSTSGQVITIGGAVNCWSRKQIVNCTVQGQRRILSLGSWLHESDTDLACLEQAQRYDYPSCVLQFTVTDCEHQELNLPWNCSCKHCNQVLSCYRYG